MFERCSDTMILDDTAGEERPELGESPPMILMATKREVSIVVPAFVLFYSGIRRGL